MEKENMIFTGLMAIASMFLIFPFVFLLIERKRNKKIKKDMQEHFDNIYKGSSKE